MHKKRAIFIDFEMQPVDRSMHPAAWGKARHEILEIGAVMLDQDGKEVDSFQCYVKPEYSTKIQETVEAMTGITAETVADAEHFAPAFTRFLDWCNSPGLPYTIYAWSGADRGQLIHELNLKEWPRDERTSYLLSHWKDFQKQFTRKIGRTRAVSLEKAVTACGLIFDGQMHDALWDARNTAHLYRLTLTERFDEMVPSIQRDLGTQEHFGASLGDMIDLTGFTLPKE